VHATGFLKEAEQLDIPAVVVLRGDDRALKHAVIHSLSRRLFGEDEPSVFRFPGSQADYKTVRDELFTVSMWSDRKLVLVEDANDFVSESRALLEKYCDAPSQKGVLVLDVTTWAKTTRLAKRVASMGLLVECLALKGPELIRWLREVAPRQFGKQLTYDAARHLVELAGDSIGTLMQELGKLSSYMGDGPTIDVDAVRSLVGGWKAETTWAMLRALRDGRLGHALADLDKLINANEQSLKTLGGISFVFRKLVRATELARTGMALRGALAQSGVFGNEISASEQYLRRIGRPRAEQIYHRLLETDLGIKGESRLPERVLLERLLVRLSGKV